MMIEALHHSGLSVMDFKYLLALITQKKIDIFQLIYMVSKPINILSKCTRNMKPFSIKIIKRFYSNKREVII